MNVDCSSLTTAPRPKAELLRQREHDGEEPVRPGGASGMSDRRLRYFVAVAEERHFGRAAERLHIAQPALSRQIAQLESWLGCELFDRSRSQIRLTAAAEALLPRARDILRRFDEAERVARRAAEGAAGVLEIGFVGSATYSVLPEILKRHRAICPEIDLRLHPMNTSELRAALLERRIQAAFARPDIGDPEIGNQLVLEEPLVVALPDGDPLVAKAELELQDLQDRAFVLYPQYPRPSFADQILSLCWQSGFAPQVAQETMDVQTALALVAVGVGISMVPASVERSHRVGVAYRLLAGRPPMTRLSLSYRADDRSKTLLRFLKTVQDFLASDEFDGCATRRDLPRMDLEGRTRRVANIAKGGQ